MRTLRLVVLAVLDALALTALRPDFGDLARQVPEPRAWLARAGVDEFAVELAGAVLWLAAIWLATGLVAALATRAPSRAGALADRIARITLPRAVYRAVAAGAGLSIALAPVSAPALAGATTPAAGRVPVPVATASAPVPAPGWPVTPSAPAPPPASQLPPPSVPAGPAPSSAGADVAVVRPGDSLWMIAASRLGPDATDAQVAASWPRWYAANRSVIGADPNLIVPGEVLHAPTATE